MRIAGTFLLTATAALSATAQTAPIRYSFDQVKRSVVLTAADADQKQVQRGQQASSGDKVRTGWFSYALIVAREHQARFEIFSSTDVQLAEGTPGVLLSLEKGRIHAIFDKLTGIEPRVVKTPGALLAVRGTQFNVEVDAAGTTSLDVFEGIVEVRSEVREPLFVRAGEGTTFGRRQPPTVRPANPVRDREQTGRRVRDGERRDPRPERVGGDADRTGNRDGRTRTNPRPRTRQTPQNPRDRP